MPQFGYTGLDGRGKKISGVIEGTGKKVVLQKLRAQGLFPTELREESTSATKSNRFSIGLSRRVSSVELAAATRQLATLTGAGLPLDEALSSVAGHLDQAALVRAFGAVREKVLQGEALNAALACHPRIFPPLYISMIEVGEHSGTLDQVLCQLADFLEEQARMRSRLQAAMAYPVLMAIIGTAVLFFLFAFVVPKVTKMLTDLGQSLPWPTRMLITGSDWLQTWWWLLLLLLAFATMALRRYGRTEEGAFKLNQLALKIPMFGKLQLLIATSRMTRTIATLLHSGVPLLKALAIATNLMSNRVLRHALEDTATAVREGEGLAIPLKRSGVFPPMVAQMAAVGERSGELETMLFRVSETYEHQVELSITGLLSLLEPIMILLMGGAVGFIVMAILLPIFQASQAMG